MEPLQAPRVFSDRYELTHLIARGGMAEVYRAQDRLLDRPVALKVLFPELSVDRTFVERFRREAQSAAKLSHPNIVPVFDWGQDDGTYFIVMEFIDGQPLSAVLRAEGALEPIRAVSIAAPVAAALAYAHRHGVVHRDVKPGNVLITSDGSVKVTDFGIARAVNTEESLTQTGAVMGTATYFSPEQAEGHGVDARSDVYSLGVVLFEMLTGRPPFLGETPVSVASKHVRDLPPLPRELKPSIPPALENIVMMAMAKSPDQRYPTAEEFRQDLVRFAEGRPVTATPAAITSVMSGVGTTQAVAAEGTRVLPADETSTPEEEQRKRTRRLILLVALLAVVLAVIIYFLGQALGYWGPNVDVPNVIGQTSTAARNTLEGDGFSVTSDIVRSTEPIGIVTATQPTAGASVSKGSTVVMDVSGGPNANDVTVPNVVGQSVTQAESTLRAHGLKPVTRTEQSSYPVYTVVSQIPVGGVKIGRGSSVVIEVSQGQTTVNVPDVRGDTPAQAGAALSSAGLTVGNTSYEASDVIGSGYVSGTSPAIGQPVTKGSTVNLIVSTGSATTTIPPTTTTPPPSTTTSAPTTTTSTTSPPTSTSTTGSTSPTNP